MKKIIISLQRFLLSLYEEASRLFYVFSKKLIILLWGGCVEPNSFSFLHAQMPIQIVGIVEFSPFRKGALWGGKHFKAPFCLVHIVIKFPSVIDDSPTAACGG